MKKEPTTHIIKEEPTTEIIKEEYTTQTIKEEPTTQIIDKELTTQIINKETTTIIINKVATTNIINKEPTTQIINKKQSTLIINTDYIIPIINNEKTTQLINEDKPTYIFNSGKTEYIIREEDSAHNQLNKTFYHSEESIINTIETRKYINKIDIENMIKIILSSKNKTNLDELYYFEIIIKTIESNFSNEYYDKTNLDKGKEELFDLKKFSVTLFSTQNNNINSNKTSIDFRNCEILLRQYYNFTVNETIYILEIDVEQEKMRIPKILYFIYGKISSDQLERLNLTICKGTRIYLYTPVIINENIDTLKSKSGYFNDICYPAKSDYGTDILLTDRKNEFIDRNKTVCQEDCDLEEYNYHIKKAKCSCKVKEFSLADIYINKTELLKNFKNIKDIANIDIIKCYKKLFTKKGIYNNIGCYILIVIIILHIISTFIFFIKQFHKLKHKIKKIIFGIKNFKLIKADKKGKSKKSKFHRNIRENKIINDNNINKIISLNDKKHSKKVKNIKKMIKIITTIILLKIMIMKELIKKIIIKN